MDPPDKFDSLIHVVNGGDGDGVMVGDSVSTVVVVFFLLP